MVLLKIWAKTVEVEATNQAFSNRQTLKMRAPERELPANFIVAGLRVLAISSITAIAGVDETTKERFSVCCLAAERPLLPRRGIKGAWKGSGTLGY